MVGRPSLKAVWLRGWARIHDLAITTIRFEVERVVPTRLGYGVNSESPTIRHRARQTKGCGSRAATLAMMFKLGCECEKSWRRLNGHEQLHKLIEGVRFIEGVAEKAA